MFEIEDYDFELPPGLIAQFPAEQRDHSRLLTADRSSGTLSDQFFFDLPVLLRPGDLLVVNDTRVVPARIFGTKESGGGVEVLVLDHLGQSGGSSGPRSCLLRASKRPRKGDVLRFGPDFGGRVEGVLDQGLVRIRFFGDRTLDAFLDEEGHMPLPPYIKREEREAYSKLDRDRYQTVFSTSPGAVAAPTAGLHFTRKLINRLKDHGISVAHLTLHVGLGTFKPVRVNDIRDHDLGEEAYFISEKTSKEVNRAKREKRRIVAVGTTSVRALETAAEGQGAVRSGWGTSSLLITPGHTFEVVDALITNFHLPKSSLLFLVSAFAGRDLILKAYKKAVERKYRFFSYGDAMLIL